LDSYTASLNAAINQPSTTFQKYTGKKEGKNQQLNANVLQIENELYSPIRPKQPTQSLEKPSEALDKRGVSYIEVRALDVNPFSAVGIEENQFYFLDVFLLYCVTKPSAMMDSNQYHETEDNLSAVVEHGRDPELMLLNAQQFVGLSTWALQIFSEMQEVALVLDNANSTTRYSVALELEKQKIIDPSLTPSAKILEQLISQECDNDNFGLALAENYRQQLIDTDYEFMNAELLAEHARLSIDKQRIIEQQDNISFDDFLSSYFTVTTTD
jgi:glutamate--cysteine ligase